MSSRLWLKHGQIDLAEGTEHADNVSVMLMAFPHLFRLAPMSGSRTSSVIPEQTLLLLPKSGPRFSDFYLQASNASKLAYKVSRADSEAEFKTLFGELRESCNACHAAFLKTE